MSEEKFDSSQSSDESMSEIVSVASDAETASYWLSALIESADDAIISKTLDGTITVWNKGAERIFGYEAAEIVGKPITVLIPPDLQHEEAEILDNIKAGKRVEHYETVRIRKDGALIDISLSVSPIKTPEGKIIGASKIARDITAFKLAERQRRESENRLRMIADALPVLISYVDNEGRYRFVNRGYFDWFGISPEQMIGKHLIEVIGEAAYKAVRPKIERVLSGERLSFDQLMPYQKDEKYIHVNYVPDFDPETKQVKGFCALVQDITENKREELDRRFLLELGEKIRYGELNPGKFLDEITEAVCAHLNAARCLFIEINEAENRGTIKHEYCRKGASSVAGEYKVSDYSPETLSEIRTGRTIVNCDAQNDPRTADIFEKTYAPYNERAYVSIPLFTDGRWTAIFWISDDKPRRWSKAEIAFLETVGERTWLAIEKLRNEEALRQSNERLKMAMDAARIYTWEMNLTTGEIEWSENLERVIGFKLPAGFGATVNDVVHPDDRRFTEQKILQAIESGENYVSEFRLVNPQTGETVWVRGQGVLVNNSGDNQPRFVGITQNITERKQAEQERENLLVREQIARQEAEVASRLKDEFLATVSHELRTPLNAILGWSQMLVSGKFNQDDTDRAVQTIYRNAKSQAQLIEDILDVSRIITGKIKLEPRLVPLAPLIQTAVESLRPAIEAKNLTLQMQHDFDPRPVYADPNRLQQVIWNLLSNAVKFTAEKGLITIALKADESNAKIIVTDTGKGISREFLPFVFERFRQADGSSTRNHGGLGLGLSIVRHIVELHGGSVEAYSAGEGAGTTFTVSLPLTETASNLSETNGSHLQTDENSSSRARSNDLSEKLTGLRVLLLDDESDTLELMSVFLAQNGVMVKTNTNVKEALETLKFWQPDVIVSDIAMPEEDGYAFIRKLRNLPPDEGGTIPVIALTAYVGIKERTEVLASGFQMYVPKPLEPSELLGALANFAKT